MMRFHALSDRALILKIASKSFNLVFVHCIYVYVPTSTNPDEDIEQFYTDFNSAHKKAGSQDMTIFMGYFNVKVGDEQDSLLESYRMMSTELVWILDFETNIIIIIIIDTYGWTIPGDGAMHQIDYITINNRFRNSILHVKCYHGADGGSDHVAIVATLRLKLRKLQINNITSCKFSCFVQILI